MRTLLFIIMAVVFVCSGCAQNLPVKKYIVSGEETVEPVLYPVETAKSTPVSELVSVGDTVILGSYEQDANEQNGKEPLEWIVIHINENVMLLISRYCIDCRSFDKSNGMWETSDLRTWLNGVFFNGAFSASERECIIKTTIKTEKYRNSDEYITTHDSVFLLSTVEAKEYLTDVALRKCSATEYAKKRGAYVWGKTFCSWWWLRSPSEGMVGEVCINHGGSIYEMGSPKTSETVGVRPALYLKRLP